VANPPRIRKPAARETTVIRFMNCLVQVAPERLDDGPGYCITVWCLRGCEATLYYEEYDFDLIAKQLPSWLREHFRAEGEQTLELQEPHPGWPVTAEHLGYEIELTAHWCKEKLLYVAVAKCDQGACRAAIVYETYLFWKIAPEMTSALNAHVANNKPLHSKG